MKNILMRQLLFAFIFLFSISIISCSDGGTGPDPNNENGDNNNEGSTTYSVAVDVSPSDAGSISPSEEDSYEEGEGIELQADANDEFLFTHWSGDIDSTSENPLSLTVDQDYNLTANFVLKMYELSINTEGEGSVTEEVIEQKSKDYEHGTVVELTANPAESYQFVEWRGDVIGSENPAQLTIDNPKEVTAVFEEETNVTKLNMPSEGNVALFQASSISEVLYVSTEEETFDDGTSGIWLSEDTGNSWEKTSDSLVTFVSIASKDRELIISGNDNGYLISTDGGMNWTQGSIDDPNFGNPLILKDASAVTADDGIFIVSSDAMGPGIYSTKNLGESWQHILSSNETGDTQEAQIHHVYASPVDLNVIYAATSFNFNFWKTENSGDSFESIKSGISTSDEFVFSNGFKVNNSNSDQLFTKGHISEDGGQTWTQVDNVSTKNTLWVEDHLVRVDGEKVLTSSDFGNSWSEILTLIGDNISLNNSPDKIYKSESNLYFSTNNSDGNPSSIYSVDLSLIKESMNN